MRLPLAALLVETFSSSSSPVVGDEAGNDVTCPASREELSFTILALTLANIAVHEANAAIEDAMGGNSSRRWPMARRTARAGRHVSMQPAR
jgi:hypothetical protein